MLNSIRARLTLWYVAVLGILLIIVSVGVYMYSARSLDDRFDARLGSTLEATAAALKHLGIGQSNDLQIVTRALQELNFPNQTVAVLDAGGHVIAQKAGPGGPPLRLPPFNPLENIRFYELPESRLDTDDSCRGVCQRFTNTSTASSYGVVVMQSIEPLNDQLDMLAEVLYIVVPFTLVLASFGGWLLAGRSLAPVVAMSEQVQHISAADLDQRLSIVNPRDELGRLATTFNDLLARLSAAFSQQRQFMADASHELRTPLSVMRTAAQVTLEKTQRGESEYRDALGIIEQQTQRLSSLVEDMFILARADSAGIVADTAELYLDEVVSEAARAAAVLATRKGVKLKIGSLTEAPYRGDERLLRQMLMNLLDNAIKYTPSGGTVSVALDKYETEYRITIADTGVGISAEAQPRIFERFFRGDQSRSRSDASDEGGAGLGLPIARWVAEAHQGRLKLRTSDPSGSTFVVFLPRA
jgi:two-component system OmpR family sensor kinase